jgi:tRNA (adenine37-N6)-methyltransferase
VPLLTREAEGDIGRRIERGKRAVMTSISRTPLIARKTGWRNWLPTNGVCEAACRVSRLAVPFGGPVHRRGVGKLSEALLGLEDFSPAEIIFYLDRIPESAIERGALHPRGNPNWPRVGIFAQRAKKRPNRLGATIVRILGHEGRTLRIAGLDAIDGTTVLDIKPVMAGFLPRGEFHQPTWATELMREYW